MLGKLKGAGGSLSSIVGGVASALDAEVGGGPPEDSADRRGFPALPLSAPPLLPTYDAPPAVRASRQAGFAAAKADQAALAAWRSADAAKAAEDEAARAEGAAAHATASRKAAADLASVDNMARSINRYLAQAARFPDGGESGDIKAANYFRRRADDIAKQAFLDAAALRDMDLAYHERLPPPIQAELEQLRPLLRNQVVQASDVARKLQAVQVLAERAKASTDEPPYLPPRLLRPDGTPWWPEEPPHAEVDELRVALDGPKRATSFV